MLLLKTGSNFDDFRFFSVFTVPILAIYNIIRNADKMIY